MVPPFVIRNIRCLTCRSYGNVEFHYDPEQGRFFTETPCSCILQPPSPLGHLAEGDQEAWAPYVLWGWRPGYAVAPAGVLHMAGGWRYAAPYDDGAVYHVLGMSDCGAYVAIRLSEAEWLALEHPDHLPCGEAVGEPVTMRWLADRLFVGTPRERGGVIIFEELRR